MNDLNSFGILSLKTTEGKRGYFCASTSGIYFQEVDGRMPKKCVFQFHFYLKDPMSNTTAYIAMGHTQTAEKYLSV